MKKVGVTFCGKRYEINLDDEFAEFVENDLKNAGVDFSIDNRPEALLKAYLRIAKQYRKFEHEAEMIVRDLARSLEKGS